MSIFGDYARYYNVLYQNKEYAAETEFILGCLKRYGNMPATLLDLGCGTGRHALEMARRGVSVTGVDMSATMLEMGRQLQAASPDLPAGVLPPQLQEGDARTVRLGKRFDAVTSLFHVMSYQNTEEDALAVMETARQHLKPGGLFLFDFWYGPGVLTDPPTDRNRIMEDAHTKVCRHAHPVHRVNDNLVDVHYSIELMDKSTEARSSLHEVHKMRYWFLPELRYLASVSGFTVMAEGAWMHNNLDENNPFPWNAWMLLQ